MTVFGFLANALILSGGIVSFWLLDREVRPPLSAKPSKDGLHTPPATRTDIPANDEEPLEANGGADHNLSVGQPVGQSAGLSIANAAATRVLSLNPGHPARRPVGSI